MVTLHELNLILFHEIVAMYSAGNKKMSGGHVHFPVFNKFRTAKHLEILR